MLPSGFTIFLYSASAFTVAVPLDPDDLRVDLGEAHPAGIGSLVIRECMHFFTLPEDPFMARKIKPPIKKGAVARPSSSQNGT